MKPGAYFRPNKEGKAVLAADKRLQRRAPEYGTWWVRYTDSAGVARRERCSEAMQEAAHKRAMELHLLAERRRKGLETDALNIIPCRKMHALYLEAHAHLSSQAPMRSQVKNWFDTHFGSMPTADVTPADCEALLTKARKAGQKVRDGAAAPHPRSPHLEVRRQPPPRGEGEPLEQRAAAHGAEDAVVFLSREQVNGILDAAGAFRFLLLLAVLTGGRRGEFGGLRWDDFHLEEGPTGTVHYRRSWARSTTKGSKARVVPLHPVLLPELERARRNATSEFVFPAPRKGGMRHEAWHTAKLVRSIARRAGVELPKGTTFHTLRKTFLTHLIRDTGGDIATAQQLAGHSTPAVTATYYVGRDVDHMASRVAALRLVGVAAAEHTMDTRAATGTADALGNNEKEEKMQGVTYSERSAAGPAPSSSCRSGRAPGRGSARPR